MSLIVRQVHRHSMVGQHGTGAARLYVPPCLLQGQLNTREHGFSADGFWQDDTRLKALYALLPTASRALQRHNRYGGPDCTESLQDVLTLSRSNIHI